MADLVPADIKADGTIQVGTDASYEPNEYVDTQGKTIVGWDIDLGKAIAGKLGLKIKFVNAPFDSIIPGLASGKYELGISSFSVTADREKEVNMIGYYSSGTAWATEKGNPKNITPDNACGQRVAVQKGTTQADDVTAKSKECTKNGKPAIKIDQYQLQSDVTTAVITGKDSAELADFPIISYAVKQTGKLQIVGQTYDTTPYGMIVRKDQTNFAKAVSGAINELMQDGTYKRILDKWGVAGGAISESTVNPTPGA